MDGAGFRHQGQQLAGTEEKGTQICADVRHAERPEGAKHLASEASAMPWFFALR